MQLNGDAEPAFPLAGLPKWGWHGDFCEVPGYQQWAFRGPRDSESALSEGSSGFPFPWPESAEVGTTQRYKELSQVLVNKCSQSLKHGGRAASLHLGEDKSENPVLSFS